MELRSWEVCLEYVLFQKVSRTYKNNREFCQQYGHIVAFKNFSFYSFTWLRYLLLFLPIMQRRAFALLLIASLNRTILILRLLLSMTFLLIALLLLLLLLRLSVTKPIWVLQLHEMWAYIIRKER